MHWRRGECNYPCIILHPAYHNTVPLNMCMENTTLTAIPGKHWEVPMCITVAPWGKGRGNWKCKGRYCGAPALAALLHSLQGAHASVLLHLHPILLEELTCTPTRLALPGFSPGGAGAC